MSLILADIGIWALLFIGVVFCGIGLMGLLIFPDTKSRMFTAFRATGIGLFAVTGAVLLYGFSLLFTAGGDEYLALILRTLILLAVLTAGTLGVSRIIRERIRREQPGTACLAEPGSGPSSDD